MARNAKSLTSSVALVKRAHRSLMPVASIMAICRDLEYSWRAGVLGPAETIRLFLLQVLHGNTSCSHVRLWGLTSFTASAYCEARKRLPLELFRRLCEQTARSLHDTTGSGRWLGRRVVLVDGSGCSMPDTPSLDRTFGHPKGQKRGCSFPGAHLLLMCDLVTGAIRDIFVGPLYTGDLAQGARLHRSLNTGDVLVGDRGFGSWGLVAASRKLGIDVVVRAHQSLKLDFRSQDRRRRRTWERIGRTGPRDVIIKWFKPDRPRWMSPEEFAAMPPYITVRVLEYRVKLKKGSKTIRLITTLTDADAYPKESLAELYRRRWSIETALQHLKTTMGMDVLRCKSPEGVMKEIYVYVIAYNLTCVVRAQAAGSERSPSRVSFIDVLRHLQCVLTGGRPPTTLAQLMVVSERPGRLEPRRLKRRPKRFSLLTRPRHEARRLEMHSRPPSFV